MMDWEDYRILRAVGQGGGVAAAARTLDLVPATIRSHLRAIETLWGGPLFETLRDVAAPTALGAALLSIAEEIAALEIGFLSQADAERDGPAGSVTLRAAHDIVEPVILPALAALSSRHPDIVVDLIEATEDLADLEDIAVRQTAPDKDDVWISRLIGVAGFGLYARQELVARAGGAEGGVSLADVGLIGPATQGPERASTDPASTRADPTGDAYRFRSDSASARSAALGAGLGAGLCAHVLAASHPELSAIHPDVREGAEVWLCLARSRSGLRRVRLVHDAVADALHAAFGEPRPGLSPRTPGQA